MSDFISISAQIGGPEAELLSQLKVPLFQSLRECVTSTHCSAIDQYDLVLRVDGTLDKFGPEGLARLRFAKARRYITLDIQVPESVWQPLTRHQAKVYLVRQVRVALEACVDRLTKDGHSVNNQLLWEEVNLACTRYLAVNGDA
jgi:hypothetical protein